MSRLVHLFAYAAAVLTALLAAAAQAQDAGLVGTWEHAGPANEAIVVILSADGTGQMAGDPIKYTVTGTTLAMTVQGEVIKYTFKLEGDSLTISDGDLDQPTLFKRKAAIKRGLGGKLQGDKPVKTELNPPAKGIEGRWELKIQGAVIPMEFKPGGTGTMNNNEMKWSLKDNILSTDVNGRKMTYSVTVTAEKLSMTNTDNKQTVTFDRAGAEPVKANPYQALGGNTPAAAKPAGLVGKWEANDGAILQFNDDGHLLYGGRSLPYTTAGDKLTFTGAGGKVEWQYQVNGDQLVLVMQGDRQTLKRIGGEAKTKEQPAAAGGGDLIGTWKDEVGAILEVGEKSMVFAGVTIPYTRGENVLNVTIQGNTMRWPCKLNGDTMQLTIGAQTTTLTRVGGAAEKPDESGNAAPAGKPGNIVGNWDGPNGFVQVREDGTMRSGGKDLRWSIDATYITITDNAEFVKIPYKFEGEKLILGTGPTQTLTRASGLAGVWVGNESSLDPQNFLSITQYVTLYSDGTVGFTKNEGGATRRQISETMERFSSFRNKTGEKGRTYGKWQADGNTLSIQWDGAFGNKRVTGRVDPRTMKLVIGGVGILEEGAAVTFERQ